MENDRPDDDYAGAGSISATKGKSTSATHDSVEINQAPKPRSLPLKEVPSLLFNRRWWWTTLLVIAGMALLARLGVWQLNRLSQRQEENKILVQQLNAPPVELSGSDLKLQIDELIDGLALVSGEFDYGHEIVLTPQRYQGQLGVHLITPLIIEGNNSAVLIDRGWVSAQEADAGNLLDFNDGSLVSIEGVVLASETISGNNVGDNLPKRDWYRVDITAIERQMPYSLLPIYLKWLPQELDLEPPIRAEREVDLSEGSHLSYAIQWFLFTTMLGIGYIAFIVRSEKK